MTEKKKRKPRRQSVTMRQNADGTITMRSYGGYDLRKVFSAPTPAPADDKSEPTP